MLWMAVAIPLVIVQSDACAQPRSAPDPELTQALVGTRRDPLDLSREATWCVLGFLAVLALAATGSVFRDAWRGTDEP